jgi:hypothetical protein
MYIHITNNRKASAEEIVFEANGRGNQENLIGQLMSGAHALKVPVDNRAGCHDILHFSARVLVSLYFTRPVTELSRTSGTVVSAANRVAKGTLIIRLAAILTALVSLLRK